MKIERIKINALKLDPNNARQHDQKNLDAIASSLKQFGQRKPIVISAENVVVAGNGTITAAQSLGWDEIDAVRVPADWSADLIKAFALADNRTAELAAWSPEVLATQLIELENSGYEIAELGFEKIQQPSADDWESAFDATSSEQKEIGQMTFTLHRNQMQSINDALLASKQLGEFGETGNVNANGNALARICELWLGENQ